MSTSNEKKMLRCNYHCQLPVPYRENLGVLAAKLGMSMNELILFALWQTFFSGRPVEIVPGKGIPDEVMEPVIGEDPRD
jgi:hypothetical protein